MSKHPFEYEKADASVLFNQSDGGLKPIRLSLPKPPDYKLIDGYGKKPEDQRFQRLTTPFKLVALEKKVRDDIKKEEEARKLPASTYKVQKRFWDEINNNQDYYNEEITWIKKVWWHRLNGYWFFNRGKPTYITGWHFEYLNFYSVPEIKPDGYPNYRDRDRKEFVFYKYSFTTKETFKYLDGDGNAIKGDDGKYEMINERNRICFGFMQPKNRRSGLTHRCLCILHSIVSMTIGTDGGGIMSYTQTNAKSHFKEKLIPAWRKFPLWLKPFTASSNDPNSVIYDTPSNEYNHSGLQTKITSADSAESTAYDGWKLVATLCDEEGKTEGSVVDVVKRFGIIRHCHAQGDGRIIFGFSMHPSTVEDFTEGGAAYLALSNKSNFYIRKPDGQTSSGLFRIFTSAVDGLDDFIDSYGYSIVNNPNIYQINEGFKTGSLEYLHGKRDFFLKKGDPQSIIDYREEKKLFPINFSDCWLGGSGEMGWNMQIIDGAIARCRSNNGDVIRGNFDWVSSRFGPVYFYPKDDGKWLVSDLMTDSRRNRMTKIEVFDSFDNRLKPMWSPEVLNEGIVGADPFRFLHKREHDSSNNRHPMSDGGITAVRDRDVECDTSELPSEWEKFGIIVSYRYRTQTDDDFAEDVLKTCIYYNFPCYPETNVETIWKKFMEWGFGGYLMYDIDEFGKRKHRPGVFNLEGSKQNGLIKIRNFIDIHGHKIKHLPLLLELKAMNSMDDLNKFDLTASFMCALLGLDNKYRNALQEFKNIGSVDIRQLGIHKKRYF